ncbi:hypothetical protein SEA_EMOTION_44 [Arthrobacter phage Emotion]|uniref:Uncharacterized protein n=1 Tax=Arthrobacter phage Emotion TaxID=3038361 RepID=A0AA49ERI3_9CAUD|nr:hypothetical protein SEA_EMOTION_44 [Arthrobacter phage Emotion]
MAGFLETDPDLDLADREHVCPDCHLVHWTPTGSSFCEESA